MSPVHKGSDYDKVYLSGHEPMEDLTWSLKRESSAHSPTEEKEEYEGDEEEKEEEDKEEKEEKEEEERGDEVEKEGDGDEGVIGR